MENGKKSTYQNKNFLFNSFHPKPIVTDSADDHNKKKSMTNHTNCIRNPKEFTRF